MILELPVLADRLKAEAGVLDAALAYGELTVTVDKAGYLPLMQRLRDDLEMQFSTFIDLTAVDYPERAKRFDVVVHLLSMKTNARVRVKLAVGQDEAAPSLVDLYPAANWSEREAFDMYGVLFEGHPDLRRILTDYGFTGHPLRKDFPLTGYVEVRYDEEQKRVVYEPVKLVQEYRNFDFMSPWEGMLHEPQPLPGDEKAKG
jgi:NADH-quinone oxidoreductase subunit C